MTKTLSKEDQKLLDQAVQEVSTRMLATKVLLAAQDAAGENGDVDRAYIKLRFRQLRHESAKQSRKVQKLREQAGKMSDARRDNVVKIRSSGSASTSSPQIFDEDGIRRDHLRTTKSKIPGLILTVLAIVFLGMVGFALINAV